MENGVRNGTKLIKLTKGVVQGVNKEFIFSNFY